MAFEDLRLERVRTVLHYASRPGRQRVSARKDHIVGIMLSGVTEHDFGYKRIDLRPGDVYFFNRRDDYERLTVEPGQCWSVHFTAVSPVEAESFRRHVNHTAPFLRQLRLVERAFLRGDAGALACFAEFYRLCDMISEACAAPYAPRDARLAEAKTHIDLHFREKTCLHDAARVCGVTPRRFNDLFRQQYALTPNRYLVDKKLAYAKTLLAQDALSVTDAAELAGFSDVCYFSRLFRQAEGDAPGRWRRTRAAEDAEPPL